LLQRKALDTPDTDKEVITMAKKPTKKPTQKPSQKPTTKPTATRKPQAKTGK
jgi:hypothetical protein